MTDNLTDLLLREQGYEPNVEFGFVACLGLSVRQPPGGVAQYSKLIARRVEYVRGTQWDPDVEVVPVALFQALKSIPLARNDEDIADAARRTHFRIGHAESCIAVPVAVDFGPGEGALVVHELRRDKRVSGSLFPLRTVADRDQVNPIMDPTRQAWSFSDEALVAGLATRALAGQVLIDASADDDTRLALLQALRDAGRSDMSAQAPLPRIMGWMAEILLRPLVPPCFRAEPLSSSRRSARPTGSIKMM